MQTVTNRLTATSSLDRVKRRAEAQAAKARDAPMFLSDRVKAWLDGLPEPVIRKGLLLADAADALGIPERRAADIIRGHGWWEMEAFAGGWARRWFPPWAPDHPEVARSEPWLDRGYLPAPAGWAAKPTWQRHDGSAVGGDGHPKESRIFLGHLIGERLGGSP